jgi:hypothetical protein
MKLMHANLQGVGGFVESTYWSSSESGTPTAWTQIFANGYQLNDYKSWPYYVRPVRAF